MRWCTWYWFMQVKAFLADRSYDVLCPESFENIRLKQPETSKPLWPSMSLWAYFFADFMLLHSSRECLKSEIWRSNSCGHRSSQSGLRKPIFQFPWPPVIQHMENGPWHSMIFHSYRWFARLRWWLSIATYVCQIAVRLQGWAKHKGDVGCLVLSSFGCLTKCF